ncbi:MAG: hypothetical protein KU29_01575 [Sulfurovum sp. FS06-10]|nr:MAG: hypothetical protein KU29_01575 [Sulfurovum sp. FS06-10]
MVLTSCFNNLLIKILLKTKTITIKGKSKVRIKKNAKLLSDLKSKLILGFGDSTTASFPYSGTNLNLMENSTFHIKGKVIIGLNSAITLHENATLEIGDGTYIGAKGVRAHSIWPPCALALGQLTHEYLARLRIDYVASRHKELLDMKKKIIEIMGMDV